jgi:hypothetical protein
VSHLLLGPRRLGHRRLGPRRLGHRRLRPRRRGHRLLGHRRLRHGRLGHRRVGRSRRLHRWRCVGDLRNRAAGRTVGQRAAQDSVAHLRLRTAVRSRIRRGTRVFGGREQRTAQARALRSAVARFVGLQGAGHLGRSRRSATEIARQRGQTAGGRARGFGDGPHGRSGPALLLLEAVGELFRPLPERERVRLGGEGGQFGADVEVPRALRGRSRTRGRCGRCGRRTSGSRVAQRTSQRRVRSAPASRFRSSPVRCLEARRPRRGRRILRCRHDSPRSAGRLRRPTIRVAVLVESTQCPMSSFPINRTRRAARETPAPASCERTRVEL